jgi:hypothetical protein
MDNFFEGGNMELVNYASGGMVIVIMLAAIVIIVGIIRGAL